jgi:hypothetical protein
MSNITIKKLSVYLCISTTDKNKLGMTLQHITVDNTKHVGTAVAQWLRCCATNRKVAGSIQPGEWTLSPTFHHWPPPPPKKQAALTWIVAHLVAYRRQTQQHLSLNDYMDFLQRARWKEYHRAPKTPTVGRYLHVL